MADLRAGSDAENSATETGDKAAAAMAALLGADDPEDIAREAFARLIGKHDTLRDPGSALAYVWMSVSAGTMKSHVSRGLVTLARALRPTVKVKLTGYSAIR